MNWPIFYITLDITEIKGVMTWCILIYTCTYLFLCSHSVEKTTLGRRTLRIPLLVIPRAHRSLNNRRKPFLKEIYYLTVLQFPGLLSGVEKGSWLWGTWAQTIFNGLLSRLVPWGTLQIRIWFVRERFDPTLEPNKQAVQFHDVPYNPEKLYLGAETPLWLTKSTGKRNF